MISEVAPKPCRVVISVILDETEGTIAIIPRAIAPININLVKISSSLSAVGLPGFTPGIAEPYFLRLSAISLGCIEGMIEAIADGDIGSVARRCYNVFEDVLPTRERRTVDNIKGIMFSCGALGSAMTGTGSAVYGIFQEEKLAVLAVSTLRREYDQCFLAGNVKKTFLN